MTGKRLRKIIRQLFLMCPEICPAFIPKTNSDCKKNYFNDPKQRKRRLSLSCVKNTICIIKRNAPR